MIIIKIYIFIFDCKYMLNKINVFVGNVFRISSLYYFYDKLCIEK